VALPRRELNDDNRAAAVAVGLLLALGGLRHDEALLALLGMAESVWRAAPR
jgi:hypothetical protein